ncbi:interferon regulatory factor 7 [Trichomycterus rosablanca]|uniref:interferon regulatory factor 7 n=1 Tax=Trichomycterus rosablanca TaxID=2290929 RepID=UPI002F35DD98
MTPRSDHLIRPHFANWLIEQVQGGHYDGLYMIGKDTFRIPWKHNSRRDCRDEDNKIFQAWAVVSGKILEYPNDRAKWKTNFRCALNSLTQFKLLQDHSKESKDPHKMYHIVWPENHQQSQTIHIKEMYSSADNGVEAMEYENLPNHMDTLHLSQQFAVQPWASYQEQNIDVSNNYIATSVPDVQQTCLQNNMLAPAQQHYTTGLETPSLPNIYALEISITYRGEDMGKMCCQGPFVQLHSQCDPSDLRGQSVPFPGTEKLSDQKQIQYTNRILDNIKRGLQLEVCQDGIFGYRQDKCNVFVSTRDPAEIPNQPEPKKLPQNQKELLFSFDKYKKDLMDFKENRRGSPEYTICLCFGEKFPDEKPIEKKLIIVKVVSLICRELHKAAQRDGASSLQNDNISLQFSHNSLFDLIEATFQLPTAE